MHFTIGSSCTPEPTVCSATCFEFNQYISQLTILILSKFQQAPIVFPILVTIYHRRVAHLQDPVTLLHVCRHLTRCFKSRHAAQFFGLMMLFSQCLESTSKQNSSNLSRSMAALFASLTGGNPRSFTGILTQRPQPTKAKNRRLLLIFNILPVSSPTKVIRMPSPSSTLIGHQLN